MDFYFYAYNGDPHHTKKTHWEESWTWACSNLYHCRKKGQDLKESSLSLAAQPSSQVVNLQLHASSILFVREVTPTSRLTPTSMHGMHTNLPIPFSLKIEELILTLGTNRLLTI